MVAEIFRITCLIVPESIGGMTYCVPHGLTGDVTPVTADVTDVAKAVDRVTRSDRTLLTVGRAIQTEQTEIEATVVTRRSASTNRTRDYGLFRKTETEILLGNLVSQESAVASEEKRIERLKLKLRQRTKS